MSSRHTPEERARLMRQKQKITIKASGRGTNMDKFSMKGKACNSFTILMVFNILNRVRMQEAPECTPRMRQAIRNFMTEISEISVEGFRERGEDDKAKAAKEEHRKMKTYLKW